MAKKPLISIIQNCLVFVGNSETEKNKVLGQAYNYAKNHISLDVDSFYRGINCQYFLSPNNLIDEKDIENGEKLIDFLKNSINIPNKKDEKRAYGRKIVKAMEFEYATIKDYLKKDE